MQLALALGMPLGVMLRSMTSRELTLWRAFYAREPFGGARDDYNAGLVASSVFNSQRASKTAPILLPTQFMAKYWQTDEERKKEEMKRAKADVAKLKALVRSAGDEAAALNRKKGKK